MALHNGAAGLHVTKRPRSFMEDNGARVRGLSACGHRLFLHLWVLKTGESGNIMTKLLRKRNEVGIRRSSTKGVFLKPFPFLVFSDNKE